MKTIAEKDLLGLLADGPTLQQLTQRINQESPEEVSPKSIGGILVALQNKGYAFLDEGRWWRTPEGVAYLEKLLAEEPLVGEKDKEKSKIRPPQLLPSKMSLTRVDLIATLAIAIAVLALKVSFSYGYVLPIWDGVIYLLNARRFLYGYDPFSLFELLRPPLLPYVISIVWRILGENFLLVTPIQSIFTVVAGLILYAIVHRMFDWKTAVLSFLIFLFTPRVFMWTNQLLTHGVQLVFTLLCIFFAWKAYSESTATGAAALIKDGVYAAFVGFFGALTSLTRYPAVVFFPSVLVLTLKRGMKRNVIWLIVCGCSFVATWLPWLQWNMAYAGGDPFASVKAGFIVGAYVGEIESWYYYLTSLVELISIVGVVFLLAGIVSKNSLKDRRMLVFLTWFALAVTAHSCFANKQLRFSIEWFPAIAVLMALGARRIQGLLKFRLKFLFNLLLALWLAYLIASSALLARADVNDRSGSTEKEFPTVVSWISANTAKSDIGASDSVFTPHFAFFAKRYFYNFEYLEDEAKARRISMAESLRKVNVSYVIVTSWFAREKGLDDAGYLVSLKKFRFFTAYAVSGALASKHLGILILGNYSKSSTSRQQLSQSSYAIQETIRGIFPGFDTADPSSFPASLEGALAEDQHPKHGLIVLLDEVWSEDSQSLKLDRAQLSVLKRLVEEYGVALLTSGNSTRGWLRETEGIKPSGASTFASFRIGESTRIPGWSNLLGKDRVWNVSVSSQFRAFSPLENVESIVETSGRSNGKGLVSVGNHGKGRVAYFSCAASDLSFSRQYSTVNPVLIRVLFWLLGDYPRIVSGNTFKVALRIDDAQASLYSSIQNHGTVLTSERHIPMSISVIPKDLSEATAALLIRLRSQGCELTLHGYPEHFDLLSYPNQTEAIMEGREVFRKWLGFYPTVLVPPLLSYNDQTPRITQALGFKAISGSSFGDKPASGTENHFGYPFKNSTVVMLPVLSLLDYGPHGGWMPSAEEAIGKAKWLLASQKWLRGSCILELHFDDARLPEIARLADWVKDIGGEFGTLEQLMTDSFMGPALGAYNPYPGSPSFSTFDMTEYAQSRFYRISFVLNEPTKLRIDAGAEIARCYVNGKAQEPKGQLIVTELLETGKEHIMIIQMKTSLT